MSVLRQLPRPRRYVSVQSVQPRHTHVVATEFRRWHSSETEIDKLALEWDERAGMIRAGMQQSMLTILEERGFVKDIAGDRQNLDWLLTKKRIGVYVGVDPTAPSLHVGHLLPLMTLFWMHLYGYKTYSLLGGGTVQIGDPSGRTTARSLQGKDKRRMNETSIMTGLNSLWKNVKCLGIKHNYSEVVGRQRKNILNNWFWLKNLGSLELMRDIGSSMRLGAMLSRDSVKMRMESGEGMSFSEFSYPLFQAYDWFHMYRRFGVQLQIGGSDQYGNIIAGMDVVNQFRLTRLQHHEALKDEEPFQKTYGLTTPLLTTASGEKFGKSAGNAVWLDPDMLDSFHLYQYFLRTADDDVERYLKLFTFLPLSDIALLMGKQKQDESKRVAQHVLAKEIVELAHGAFAAQKAETSHKEAFQSGTNTFALGAIRAAIAPFKPVDNPDKPQKQDEPEKQAKEGAIPAETLLAYKKAYAAPPNARQTDSSAKSDLFRDQTNNVVTVPISMLKAGSFPDLLLAAGLVASKSEGSRLIASKGAYVVVPNSGTVENPTSLQWTTIEPGAVMDPNHFLVDWEVLVLRSGKSKIQILHVVTEADWEQFKSKHLGDSEKQV